MSGTSDSSEDETPILLGLIFMSPPPPTEAFNLAESSYSVSHCRPGVERHSTHRGSVMVMIPEECTTDQYQREEGQSVI